VLLPGRRYPSAARSLALSGHEISPECALGFELVVRAAAQAQVLHRGATAARHRLDMIERDEPSGAAAAPIFGDDGALGPIALPDRAPDLRRDGSGRCAARGPSAGPRLRGRGKATLLDLGDERIAGPVQDLRDVA